MTRKFKYPLLVCIKIAMHACVKEWDVVDTKKDFVSTSTKTYEVGESLVCERKPSDRYASSLWLFVTQR